MVVALFVFFVLILLLLRRQLAWVPNIHGTFFSGLVHIRGGGGSKDDTCGSACGGCIVGVVAFNDDDDDKNIDKSCLRLSERKSY